MEILRLVAGHFVDVEMVTVAHVGMGVAVV